jgi:hypothetical protein
MMDAVPLYQFNTTPDRPVAQRNIAVVYEAPSAAELDVSRPWLPERAIGRRSRHAARPTEVNAMAEGPGRTCQSGVGCLRLAKWSQAFGRQEFRVRRFSLADLPYEARASLPHRRVVRARMLPLRMHFHASIADLGPGEAQVLRLRHRVNDEVIGGCTVVLLGIGS